MYFTEQPQALLERLMKRTMEHFKINANLSTISITYQDKECEVYSECLEPIYLKMYEIYQEETRRYQEALTLYETLEQSYLMQEEKVTPEALAHHQQLVLEATPKDYNIWYEEVIQAVVREDMETFKSAAKIILDN